MIDVIFWKPVNGAVIKVNIADFVVLARSGAPEAALITKNGV
jgi:hypothetical protein